MKKLVFSLLIFSLIALPLNGCFFGGEEEIVEPVFETYEGTLKSLGGIRVSDNATHLLQTEDGDIFYVYSEKFDLDDEDYLGNVLEVYGEVTEASEKGKDVLKITEVDVLEIEEEEADEIKEQTYEDKGLGFALEISSDWEVDRHSDYVKFEFPLYEVDEDDTEEEEEESDETDEEVEETSLDPDYILITLHTNTDELTLEEWLTAFSPEAAEIAVASSVGQDFMNSLEIETELDDVHTFYVERGGDYVYEISHFNNDIDHRSYFRNMFYDALSTFRAIPMGDGYNIEDIESDEEEEEDNDEDPITNDQDGEDEEDAEEEAIETDYTSAMAEIEDQISDIAPEAPSVGGTWVVTRFEFADPHYVYVDYEDGHDMRRVLLQYGIGPGLDYEVLGYFEPGDYTDWELVSGDDEASSFSKTVFETGNSAEAVTIMEGYRYFESGPYDFMMQYPSNWYYSGGGGHYSFSDSAEGDEVIGLDILDESVSSKSGSSVSIDNGKTAKFVSSGGNYGIYVERDDDSCYYVEGPSSYESVILDMAGSIVD